MTEFVSHSVYIGLVTFLIAGTSAAYGAVEIVRLGRLFRAPDFGDPIFRDRVFGSLIGLTIGIIGIIACADYHL